MLRIKIFYPLMLVFFVISIWLIIISGYSMFPAQTGTGTVDSDISLVSSTMAHLKNPISILLIQIVLIVGVARMFGMLFRRIGQPLVIGEIVAGILLGPSLLGWLIPEATEFIFPKSSMSGLGLVSQLGLILFMFLIGMELDVSKLKSKVHSAIAISHTSIIVPFLLGMLLAFVLYPKFSSPQVSFLTFSLFMGIAMSITAFPVLARILQDHGLTSTRMGSMALACAAADDVTAWSILALVLALARSGGILSGVITVAMALMYIAIMLRFVQPLLQRFSEIYVSTENLSRGALTVIFLFIFSSALITEAIGIHALFGAFLAGTIMPSGQRLKPLLAEKIRDFSSLALLPLFFAFTGLRTSIGLLNSVNMWLITGLVIAVAVVGKVGGSAFAARITGESWRDSLAIGALMNTRGLMELIVLNIGYDLGILSSEVFSMMVLMALVTTATTGPALSLIWKLFPETNTQKVGVMISYATEKSGLALAKLADKIFPDWSISMLHFTTGSSTGNGEADDIFNENSSINSSFRMKMKEFIHGSKTVNFISRPTENIIQQILLEEEKEKPEILLVGSARGLFTRNIFGGLIHQILTRVKCHVGVFIGDEVNTDRVMIVSESNGSNILEILKSELKLHNSETIVLSPDQLDAHQYIDCSLVIIESRHYERWSASIKQPCLVLKLRTT